MTRFIYLFLSLFLVLSGVTQANAASKWQVDTVKSSGARVVLGASNNGYKSAINIAPNVLKIAKYGLKGANLASWAFAAAGLINDGIDFVLDPENNQVKYKRVSATGTFSVQLAKSAPTREEACQNYAATNPNYIYVRVTADYNVSSESVYFDCYVADKRYDWSVAQGGSAYQGYGRLSQGVYKSLSLDSVAPKIVQNAQDGNAQAQALLRDVATAAVIAGDYDADLLAGAVPTTETKPLIPSIPGAQAGDVATGVSGAAPGQAAEDSRKAAEAAKKSAEAAKDAAVSAAEEARKAADDAKDLINSAVDQAIKDAAAAVAAEAAKAAEEAAKVADAAAVESAKAAAEAARKAAEAAKVESAKQAEAAAALEAARAAGDAARIAAAEAALAQAKADAATAAKAAEEAKAAAEEAAAAKPEAKPFELPAFCSWASKVCDLADWVMKDDPLPPDIPIPEQTMEVKDPEVFDKSYVNVSAECPSDIQKSIPIGTNSFSLVIPMTPVCDFGSTVIKPVIIFIAFIQAALMIGTVFKVG